MRNVLRAVVNGLEKVGEWLDDLGEALPAFRRPLWWVSYNILFARIEMPIRRRWQVWY